MMGKLKCTCGFEILQTSEGVSHKANFIPNQSYVVFCKRLNAAMDLLLKNCGGKERNEWIRNQLGEDYPEDVSNADMLLDYFSNEVFELAKNIYQCEGCNRIWIQRENTHRYTSFVPENLEKSKNILGTEHKLKWSHN